MPAQKYRLFRVSPYLFFRSFWPTYLKAQDPKNNMDIMSICINNELLEFGTLNILLF